MRKILKILGITVAILLLLLVAAAIALPLLVDPNDFKPQIVAEVRKATGRELEIPGDIDLTVFPWLGAELGAVRLGNAPGFGEAPFAAVDGVQVRVKVLPLLGGKVQVGKVVLVRPVIRLQRNADGASNWDDLAGQPATTEPGVEEAPGETPELSVDGLEIRDATLSYEDAAADLGAQLTEFHLEAGQISLPADFPLAMRGRIRLSEPRLEGMFEFEGRLVADPGQQQFAVHDGKLMFDGKGKALPVSPLKLDAAWALLAANLQASTAEIQALQATAFGMQANVTADVNGLDASSVANGELSFRADDLAQTASQLGKLLPSGLALSGPAAGALAFEYDGKAGTAALKRAEVQALGARAQLQAKASGLPDAVVAEGSLDVAAEDLGKTVQQLGTLAPQDLSVSGEGGIKAEFSYNQPTGRADVPVFAANALGVDVRGNVSASGLNEAASFKGKVQVAEFSPGKLLVKLGQELPPMRDGKALDKAALSAAFDVAPNRAVIDELQATLDQTTLRGRVEVADIEKQAVRFELALDQIDVDRYLPPAAAEPEQPAGAETPLDQMEIPAELIRGYDVVGKLTIGALKAFDFNSRDVNVGVRAQNDRLRVHPAEAKFYGGGYSGDLQLDASGKVPVISVDEHVQRVQLAPMVKDFLEVENISGTAKIDVTATARGRTVGALRKTLDGKFAMDVKDGAIEGFNLWESIRGAYATLKGRSYESNAPERTEFADLAASGTISKGVLRNDDLVARLPFLRVNGNGSIDIAQATMDYTVTATVLKSPELTGGIEELSDTAIPVRLTGPLLEPTVRPDVKGVLEAKAKEALKRKEQELRDEAKRKAEEERKRLEERAKEKLKGLFD